MEKILVIGSEGQLGSELSLALCQKYGLENVVCADIRNQQEDNVSRIFERLDVMNVEKLDWILKEYDITQVYHLAAMLSAKGEKYRKFAWSLNVDGLLNVLDSSVKHGITKMYFPSSIAAFGNETPKNLTPQNSYMNPNTVYGISKLTGELWCQYYFEQFGLDVRSLRYPGILSYKTPPGGGTTDYAVEIFFEALKTNRYTCFLDPNTELPMMYIDDAIKATLMLMDAPKQDIKIRTSYNIAAISFTPNELAQAIKKHLPDFEIDYKTDHRQLIANSWPKSIDDQQAHTDWQWKPDFYLQKMVETMIDGIKNLE